jgi:transposase
VTTQATSTTNLPDDLLAVKHKLEQLAAEGRVDALIEMVVELLARMRDSNNALATRLANALRELYGRKSQKVTKEEVSSLLTSLGMDAPASAAAANDGPPPSSPPASCSGSENVPQPPEPPNPPRPPRGGRSPLPAHLPRRERKVPVAEKERVCPLCGGARVCIGYRTSEILEFVSAHFEVIEEKREKVACPRCPEEGVATAPSEKGMDRGRPGPALLANILVEKFDDSMPLYRQSQQYKRDGVWLSPSTLGDWSAYGIDVLTPIANRIRERVFGSGYVRADDTGIRVLDRDHPNGVKLGHMWAFVGSEFQSDATKATNELVAFDYATNWKSDHPAKRLQSFTGDLQGDGYAGYGAMLRDGTEEPLVPEERRLGCGMHIRAKFEKAAKGNDARAAVALAYFKAIYRIEASCKTERLSSEARKARRDEQSMPHVNELYRWIHEIHPQLVPKTPLFIATQYAINQETAWRRCFTDGRFEIDNGEVERRIRKVAVGRKNYLFAGSDKGAERLAVAYTVFGSCHMHGVNTLAWATDVIRKLQDGWPKDRIDELLPDAWAKATAATQNAPVVEAA